MFVVKSLRERASTASSFEDWQLSISYAKLLESTNGFSKNNLIGSVALALYTKEFFLEMEKLLQLKYQAFNNKELSRVLLGSKTLETNVLELYFVLCWQTMIKTFSLGLDLLKVWFNVSLKSSNCWKLLFNFCKARSIKDLTRLMKNRGSEIFCRIFKCSPSPYDV